MYLRETEKERENEEKGQREREKDSQADLSLSVEPHAGLDVMTLRLGPELKSQTQESDTATVPPRRPLLQTVFKRFL